MFKAMNGSGEAGTGYGLVGALASGICSEGVRGQGFAWGREAGCPSGQVCVEGANNSDCGWRHF